jgi:septum formation protein
MASVDGDGPARPPLILASASPRRKDLLTRIGLPPDRIAPANIDESEKPKELPRDVAERLALEKGGVIAAEEPGAFVISADTVVAVGRRILPKTESEREAEDCLRLMSGRAHRVYGGVCVHAPGGQCALRVVETRVQFKALSEPELRGYLASGEWRGKAGGYGIQGRAELFVRALHGSHSNVVGLSLRETWALLEGLGYPVHEVAWCNAS